MSVLKLFNKLTICYKLKWFERIFKSIFTLYFFRFKNWFIEKKEKKNFKKAQTKIKKKKPTHHQKGTRAPFNMMKKNYTYQWHSSLQAEYFLTQSQWRWWVYDNGSPDFKGIFLASVQIFVVPSSAM